MTSEMPDEEFVAASESQLTVGAEVFYHSQSANKKLKTTVTGAPRGWQSLTPDQDKCGLVTGVGEEGAALGAHRNLHQHQGSNTRAALGAHRNLQAAVAARCE